MKTTKTKELPHVMAALDNKLKAVSPHIVGFNSNGRIDYGPEATNDEKIAAQAIMNAWNWDEGVDRPLTLQEQVNELEARLAKLEKQTEGNRGQ